jgi:hypothetical protein
VLGHGRVAQVVGVGVPDAPQQLCAAEHPSRVRGEEREEVELARRERHLHAVAQARPGPEVDLDRADRERLAGVRGARTAQHRADARGELAGGEGLHEVVVGAQVEAQDAVRLAATTRQHDDRDVLAAGDVAAADGAQDVEPAHRRQRQVEHDHPGARGAHALEGGHAVGGLGHDVALGLELPLHHGADAFVVVDHEHPEGRRAGAPARVAVAAAEIHGGSRRSTGWSARLPVLRPPPAAPAPGRSGPSSPTCHVHR